MGSDIASLASTFATASAAAPPPGLSAAGAGVSTAAATKTGRDFEAFFLSQTFASMYSGVDSDPEFGGGNGEFVFRSMLLQEYSKVAANSASTGIADEVTREILRLQEAK